MSKTLSANRVLNQLMVDTIERFWAVDQETMYREISVPELDHKIQHSTVGGSLVMQLFALDNDAILSLLADPRPERPRLFDFCNGLWASAGVLSLIGNGTNGRNLLPEDVEVLIMGLLQSNGHRKRAMALRLLYQFINEEFIQELIDSSPELKAENWRRISVMIPFL